MTEPTPDELAPHLRDFVLPYTPVEPQTSGDLDFYVPDATPAPAVLMVHGGPIRRERVVKPRAWPAFRAYGALLAQAGLFGVMFEHGFESDETLPRARDDVRRALDAVRSDPRVDADRVGLWFFSAGGFLLGSFLDLPPDGVLGVAGTYAAVGDPELPDLGLVDGIEAAPRSSVPLLLVRPEHDFDWIVPITDELLSGCASTGRSVDVIDVPGAHHAYETVDDTDAAREAIRGSIDWWARTLGNA
jgi:dienelactone hydrolase